METKKQVQDSLVFPGALLCTEEEFGVGFNTQTNVDGQVFSSTVGTPIFDSKNRIVRVAQKTRTIQFLQPRSIIKGRVVLVKDHAAIIEILSAEKNGVIQVIPNVTAAIPVSRMDQEFVRSAREKYKVGDLVSAIVEKVVPWGIDLNTQFFEFGVIKAFCSRCRQPLRAIERQLKCTSCGNIEYRKLSKEYSLR
ncbi:exosome complex RNA-binding protein Csl4 [Candidatus Micrarchaeota archaeon]|nr:exosome complex RNA-binding protein Csl4 [Candidatus Micrarchaeota archaeon]MBU1930128.1 exosome complex RNA-binding protein Csl4 [Candidatus Micrarchaeota archaeon]